MSRNFYTYLIAILVVIAVGIWIVLPINHGVNFGAINKTLDSQLGLDLRGGMRVLLEVPEGTTVTSQNLEGARKILENRANGLGVSEVTFQIAGDRRIVGEFPGLTNTEEVIAALKQTGQLYFVHLGSQDNWLPEGTEINVDASMVGQPLETILASAANSATLSTDTVSTSTVPTYPAILTGASLDTGKITVSLNETGQYYVGFELNAEGAKVFADYTTAHQGEILAIVLDNRVVSAPRVNGPITEGKGIIEGNFTAESANQLAVQLRYGSLPVPFEIVESNVIGPSLGQDSLNKSLVAGIAGLIIVMLFMAIYYRLPGVAADLAILTFALITLAIYRSIPVTLTLPGIAGFLLSIGSALDANILMFERLKEELRAGRTLETALSLSWKRAWPSIFDSNVATLITCAILFWFGSAFGASQVKGFALTLAMGVFISVFCAFMVTRTFLRLGTNFFKPSNLEKWFGI
ncbi:MAG TPA: protein translocase subunit SecD [Anaerolineaceae bacterium]|nr:protein translocase subunit SecD [Anaerolineaceae bacterium]HPN51708.1 protein translocase subunit SecD [Anaerolineaceae bacterium]